MSGRFNSIDLGPMFLPFFEQNEFNGMKFNTASKFDVDKLNKLLDDSREKKQSLEEVQDIKIISENDHKNFILFLENSEKIYKLSSLASEVISPLSVESDSTISCTELKISENLLPDSTITASKKEGKYYFDLRIGSEFHRKFVVQKLPELVRQIGERINYYFVISVFDLDNKISPVAICAWPDLE